MSAPNLSLQAQQDRAKSLGANLRQYAFRRILLLIIVLQEARFPKSRQHLTDEVNERMLESWHYRTICRDLKLLENIGVAKSSRFGWEWVGFSQVDFLQQWDTECEGGEA